MPTARSPQTRRLGLACFFLAAIAAITPAAGQSSQPNFAPLAHQLLPAVVNVSTTQTIKPDPHQAHPDVPQFPPGSPFEEFFKDFFDKGKQPQAPRKAQSLGSGFIIDPSGLVVTNNHVIADADEITVILQDDTNLKAELVGRDPKTDLALLRVKSDKPLPAVAWGDSDKLRVGDWVVAIGNPYGLGGTVTAGIISARSREINNNGPYDDFLQTDASINRGNSGGPLFALNGEVMGINSAIFSPSGGSVGIGFAIPSNLARHVIDQFREFGKARRGWLGVRLQTVTDDVAQAMGLDQPRGVMVGGLIEDSPAAQSALQPGDIVLAVEGKETPTIRRCQRAIGDAGPDKTVTLTVWRQRREQTVQAKLGEADESTEQVASLPKDDKNLAGKTGSALGLSLAEATPELREKFRLNDAANIVVTDVAQAGAAHGKDLKPGDVIVEVGQEEVRNLDDLTRKIEEARKAGRKSVTIMVDRGGDLHYVVLRVDQG